MAPSLREKLALTAQTATPDAEVVGLGRFELPTSRLSSARSNQLSYKPEFKVLVTGRTGSEAKVSSETETFRQRLLFPLAKKRMRRGLVHEERET